MVNIVVDHDDRPESYYWEPDPVLVEKSGEVNVEAMKEERDGEMNWLKGFKGV